MKNIKRIRLILLCFSVVVIAAVVVAAVSSKKKQIVTKTDMPQTAGKNAPNIELKNVAYSTTNIDNFKEWDLNAESAQYLQGEKRVLLDNLAVNVYRPDGKIYRIRGQKGEFNTESRDIKIRGAVHGVMPDNTTIQTESIDYDHEKRLITTQDKVFIQRGTKFALEGKGVIVDLAKEKMTILSNVKALGSK
jgi:LPS export ABC transporter protein LptC